MSHAKPVTLLVFVVGLIAFVPSISYGFEGMGNNDPLKVRLAPRETALVRSAMTNKSLIYDHKQVRLVALTFQQNGKETPVPQFHVRLENGGIKMVTGDDQRLQPFTQTMQ